jgi:hypothetical protein
VALAAACGRGPGTADVPGAEASAPAPTPGGAVVATAPVTPGEGACPHDGRWRTCGLLERLDQAGLAPRVDSGSPAREVPFLGAPAVRLMVGRAAVHAFVYDDTSRLRRDVAALDTTRVAPRGGTFDWEVPPVFVRSANLVAVLLVPNARQQERVRLAIEAGPPPRNPDRP